MSINIKNVTKEFTNSGVKQKVLDNISLNIEDGVFVCLLGKSGCGKSTLLNMIAGFDTAYDGHILIDGEKVEKPRIDRVTIFQNYGLLPWRNVLKNVELGLETLKIPKKDRENIAMKYLKLVGLEKYKNHKVSELSGGMQQRTSIARALAVKPKILFMDEPYGALDPITRKKLQEDIKRIWKDEKMTIIFVTHDVEEAAYLGTKIVVLKPNPGKISDILDNNLKDGEDERTHIVNMKDRIFNILERNNSEAIEYYI